MKVTRPLIAATNLIFDLLRSENVEGHIGSHNISDKSIVINVEDNIMFVPSMCIRSTVRELLTVNPVGEVVYPMSFPHNIYNVRSFDQLFLKFACSSSSDIVCVTLKDIEYYGGLGLIMNKDYIPLIAIGFEIRTLNYEVSSSYEYIGPVCYINPSVFIDTDPVSKGIVTRIIPYFSQIRTYRTNHDYNRFCCTRGDVKIKITSDITELIHRVKAPSGAESTENDIYNILNNNIKDIRI